MVDKQDMIKYLEERGWVIKNNTVYLPEDTEYEIPYNIEMKDNGCRLECI